MAAMNEGTSKQSASAQGGIAPSLIHEVGERLARNKRVRRTLPEKGRLHIDRQLPFLCVYRHPPGREDVGTERLVKGEASYLVAPGSVRAHKSVSALVREVARTLAREFGAFLIVELWAAPDGGQANDPAVPAVWPTFTVHAPPSASLTPTVETLEKRLKRIKVLKQGVQVEVIYDGKGHPPELQPLLKGTESREFGCALIGVSVPPVYRKPDTQAEFPLILRSLRHSLGLTLRQTFFEFARSCTTHRPPHYHALGRKAVVKAVWEVDRQLADVSNAFDYLLQLTPVNTFDAWKQFRRERFERAPEFHYRPLPIDPAVLKRKLYTIPVERVEDPALQRLFQEKQAELDLKITMLRDRDTPRFLYESLQLFGSVEDELLDLANGILDQLSRGPTRRAVQRDAVNAEAFAQRANADFESYRQACPEFKASTRITGEVSGLLVSRGRLLISPQLNVPASRVDGILAHEVGTHLVTYNNGRLQPFQQLYAGLAGYEELQEGLAVLAEYLVGQLSRSRMRQLAARVVATRQRIDGASFVDTFRWLDRTCQFTQQAAYTITMRIHRGGGFTKDAVYLRGLRAILRYVQKGGVLEPLLVGKIALEHIPIVKELQYRNVLGPPPIVPRWVKDPAAAEQLAALRKSNLSVLEMVGPVTG
jgi:uncharacterized protein (TIGR02421 family)